MMRIVSAMLLAMLLLWGGFTAFVLWGDNYRMILPQLFLQPDELDWQMLAGRGAKLGDDWAIVEIGRRGYSRIGISLPWPESPQRFKRVEVRFGQDMLNRSVSLGWSRSSTISPRHFFPLEMKSGNVGVVDTSRLVLSKGEVEFLALEVLGGIGEPLLVESIRMIPARPGFVTLQKRLVSEWLTFSPWTQRNTNYTTASSQPVMVSPAVAVAAWALLVALLAWMFGRFSARAFWIALLVACCMGWLALDLRWQADLLNKSMNSLEAFGGKSWQERRAKEIDGQLIEFIQELKQALGPEKRRVFALGYGEYWRLRARYHALPWSTRSTERPIKHGWATNLASGDLLLLLDTPHIDEVLPEFVVNDASVFRKVLKPADMAGRGAALVDGSSKPVLETLPGNSELVRAELDDVPARAFYRVTARLRGKGDAGSARLVVRWLDGEGREVVATARLFSVSAREFDEYAATFVLPDQHEIKIFVVDETGGGLQAESVEIELLKEKNLLWLQSDPTGPFLVVRPVLVERLNRAYEVL